MLQTIKIYKAAAEPTRLRILALLGRGELCVCALVAVLKLPQSTVSRHLAVLKNSGWVNERRQGVWTHYRLVEKVSADQSALRQGIMAHLSGLPELQEDLEHLANYLCERGKHACG